MALTATRYEHIVTDEQGVPLIAGTTMKVIELVIAQCAYGWDPDELHTQHPYLTLGQIYSALAYYWGHQEELDRDIAARLATVEELRRTTPQPSAIARLKLQRG